MLAFRGGHAMATHGRHILVENGRARARKLAALAAAAAALAGCVSGIGAGLPRDQSARGLDGERLAPICYVSTFESKLSLGCWPELTTRPVDWTQPASLPSRPAATR
jgi:hypothetical protein